MTYRRLFLSLLAINIMTVLSIVMYWRRISHSQGSLRGLYEISAPPPPHSIPTSLHAERLAGIQSTPPPPHSIPTSQHAERLAGIQSTPPPPHSIPTSQHVERLAGIQRKNFEDNVSASLEINTTQAKKRDEPFYSEKIGQYLNIPFMKDVLEERKPFQFTLTPWRINPEVPRSPKLIIGAPGPSNLTSSSPTLPIDLQWTMVVFVKSKSSNFMQRKIARWTWAGFEFVNGFRLETIFIVGRPDNDDNWMSLKLENNTHGDLLQIGVEEKYTSVIYKTMAGMQYAADHFPSSWFYTSADDDIMPDLVLIQEKLKEMIGQTNGSVQKTKLSNCTFENQFPVLCGFGYNLNPKPYRNNSKWSLNYTEYPLPLFPPYCNGGWYIMTVKLAEEIYSSTRKMMYFWIDDMWVTGLLRLRHFARLTKNCFLNDTTVGLWTANSRYFSFSKTGNDDLLMTKWAEYAAKIYQRKHVHVGVT